MGHKLVRKTCSSHPSSWIKLVPIFFPPELSNEIASNLITHVDHALFDFVDGETMLVAYISQSTMVRFTSCFASKIGGLWFYGLYFLSCRHTNWTNKW